MVPQECYCFYLWYSFKKRYINFGHGITNIESLALLLWKEREASGNFFCLYKHITEFRHFFQSPVLGHEAKPLVLLTPFAAPLLKVMVLFLGKDTSAETHVLFIPETEHTDFVIVYLFFFSCQLLFNDFLHVVRALAYYVQVLFCCSGRLLVKM